MAAVVVKVGGSLLKAGRLDAVLDVIAAGRLPIVVVPGGGFFADAVRTAQAEMGFNDRLAHRLALLSMHQMAEVIVNRSARFQAGASLTAIEVILAAGRVPVLLPFDMMAEDPTLPQDWSVTSDGIAARLTELIGGDQVVLLKSADIDRAASLEALVLGGVVDPTYAEIVARAGISSHILGPGQMADLKAVVNARV